MYTKTQKGVIQFDGQQIEYELTRLTVAESRTFREGGSESVEKAFREHLVALTPVRAADGTEIPLDTIMSEFYFRPLVNALLEKLTEKGDIPKALEGPSDASLPAGSPGDATR